jgi:hypothetical protein
MISAELGGFVTSIQLPYPSFSGYKGFGYMYLEFKI